MKNHMEEQLKKNYTETMNFFNIMKKKNQTINANPIYDSQKHPNQQEQQVNNFNNTDNSNNFSQNNFEQNNQIQNQQFNNLNNNNNIQMNISSQNNLFQNNNYQNNNDNNQFNNISVNSFPNNNINQINMNNMNNMNNFQMMGNNAPMNLNNQNFNRNNNQNINLNNSFNNNMNCSINNFNQNDGRGSNNFYPPNMPNLSLMNNNSCPNFINNMQFNPNPYPNQVPFPNQNPNQIPNPNPNNNLNTNPVSNQVQSMFTIGITYPHKAGLINVGQSCYMNATIECLSNIKGLSNKLLENYGTYNIDSQPLCVSYSSLLCELFHTKEKCIRPQIFKEIIGKLNPLFEGNHAADAKDLIFFIIETLHKELLPPSQNEDVQIDFVQQEIDSQSEQKMLNNFFIEYNKNNTLVSNLFYGINRSVMYCEGCQKFKYSFQVFNILIFPLKKVKDYKKKKCGGRGGLDLNLYDAFDCEQEVEKLEGENMIYCNRCKRLSPGSHQQQIFGMPQILIIILNRGRNNEDFNEEFRFDEYLDFTNRNNILNPQSYKRFYLSGIITHLGESGSGGHFIAYCRNKVNDDFTCYNDATAVEVSLSDAMATKISYRENEKKTPYILLYHSMK